MAHRVAWWPGWPAWLIPMASWTNGRTDRPYGDARTYQKILEHARTHLWVFVSELSLFWNCFCFGIVFAFELFLNRFCSRIVFVFVSCSMLGKANRRGVSKNTKAFLSLDAR